MTSPDDECHRNSNSTATGLRRNGATISSTSPCMHCFVFPAEHQIWLVAREKSLSSRIARNHDALRLRWNWSLFFIVFFLSPKTAVVVTEDMFNSQALSIRMILWQNARLVSSGSPQFDAVVMENSFLVTLYEWLLQRRKKKTHNNPLF